VDEKDHEIAHLRIVARNAKNSGNSGQISNSPWTGWDYRAMTQVVDLFLDPQSHPQFLLRLVKRQC
jgi:hypothetical protein